MAIAILHHLDDREALSLLGFARELLRPGGRFVSLDGCYVEGQSRVARWFLRWDRGQNVRTEAGYLDLASQIFPGSSAYVRHDLMQIPYTHVILNCARS